mgnify:CR=1 FL=1
MICLPGQEAYSTVNFSQPKSYNHNAGRQNSDALPKITKSPYRNLCLWRIDSDTAAICMINGTMSSTFGYLGRSSFFHFLTATLSTPVTHCTVVLIPRIFLVPAYPPSGFSYPSNVVTGGSGSSVTIFFPYSILSTDGGVGSSSINSLIQSPRLIGFMA